MTGPGVPDTVHAVDPADWHDRVAALVADGFGFLHSIGAVDELGRDPVVRICCRLWRDDGGAMHGVRVETSVDRGGTPEDAGRLASVSDLLAGAAWYEREIHDFFGVRFVPVPGAPDPGLDRPLLNHNPHLRPLRKDVVLPARVGTPWPGAKEPGEDAAAPSRRRMAPPGVPDPEIWGQRPPGQPAPTPEEMAAALSGGRVRRRR